MTKVAPPLLTESTALFLDFDGTLAPIVESPAAVHLSAEKIETLRNVQRKLSNALAIISGRALADIRARIPEDILVLGNHGLEVSWTGSAMTKSKSQISQDALTEVSQIADAFDGVWLEDKGATVALHYRKAPEFEAQILNRVRAAFPSNSRYKIQSGKCVIELKPVEANKGRAIADLMTSQLFAGRCPVMVGDDQTDEDAFAVVNELNGFGVKIGFEETCARFRIPDPESVWRWLIASFKLQSG